MGNQEGEDGQGMAAHGYSWELPLRAAEEARGGDGGKEWSCLDGIRAERLFHR